MRMFGFRILENFNYPVHRAQHPRVLAALAHLAVELVPRLPLHPARRQPARRAARVREPRHRVPAVRPVARRELAVRAVGRVARRCSSSSSARASTACCAGIGPLAHVVCAAGGDGRLGAVPLRHARRRRSTYYAALLGHGAGRSVRGIRWPSSSTRSSRSRCSSSASCSRRRSRARIGQWRDRTRHGGMRGVVLGARRRVARPSCSCSRARSSRRAPTIRSSTSASDEPARATLRGPAPAPADHPWRDRARGVRCSSSRSRWPGLALVFTWDRAR